MLTGWARCPRRARAAPLSRPIALGRSVLPHDAAGTKKPMKPRSAERTDELLQRITGEAAARDKLDRVARELRRRHDDLRERRRRQVAAGLAGYNPRRQGHRARGARALGARR